MIPATLKHCLGKQGPGLRGQLSTWLGVGFVGLLAALPQGARHALGRGIGRLAYRYNHKRRRIVHTNLRFCFPGWSEQQREEVARAHFLSMGRSFMDYGAIWFASRERLIRSVELEGWEHVEAARAQGKKIAYHVAHCAGLEFAAVAVGSRERSVGIYQPMKNKVVDCLIRQARLRFIYKLNGRREGLRGNIQALKAGHSVFSLTDEDMGPEQSVFVPFFAEEKATLSVTARLAVKQDAAVIPSMVYFDEARQIYVLQFGEALAGLKGTPAAAESDARILNQGLEALIEQHPHEYMWTLRLFKTRRDGSNPYRLPSS